MPFQKGNVANPKGRPKGSKDMYTINDFKKAMRVVEKRKKGSFFARVIEVAWTNPKVMVAVLKKLIPDQTFVQGDFFPEDLLREKISFIPENGDKLPEHLARFVN